jgi:rhamnose transport system permease protein
VNGVGRVVLKAVARWETLLVVLIIAAGVWSWTLSSFFLQRANLLDILTPYAFLGLLAFGLTFVVIAGEIDISVCSTMAVSAVCFAEIWNAGVNVWLAALAALGVATALGLVNGVLIGILNLPSLAITLGTLAAFRGLAFVILGGSSVSGFPTSFTKLGGGYIHNELPNALLVLVGFALVLGLLLHASRFGRYLYAIGSNREAAQFSGIPVARTRGRRHLRWRRDDARRLPVADVDRRPAERDVAREPRRPDAGHRHRRAADRSHPRRKPSSCCRSAWSPLADANFREGGG